MGVVKGQPERLILATNTPPRKIKEKHRRILEPNGIDQQEGLRIQKLPKSQIGSRTLCDRARPAHFPFEYARFPHDPYESFTLSMGRI